MAVDVSNIPIPPLPTLASLNATVPDDVDAHKVASEWLTALSRCLESNNPTAVKSLFVEDSWWRDMFLLTWDFRTFHGISSIITFLEDRIKSTHPRSFKLRQDFLGLQRPYEDMAWIVALFDFETDTGLGLGIIHLVPTSSGDWKAHTIYTNLEGLKGFPEKIGALRNHESDHGRWEEDRDKEKEFESANPTVLIIGGGHSGLSLAARLKAYDIPNLIVERNERIGDNWRNRYDALCLHDPVWNDHMPYLLFPPTWPTYAPARKVANWLEAYADILDLNVWTSSEVQAAVQNSNDNKWKVTVKRGDGTERVLTVNHVVFSTGFSGGMPKIPQISGMETFKGTTLHSSQHKRASDHAGKKVVVIGACTSAHDIAQDYYNHGIDVTMYQRNSTYIMSQRNGFDVIFKGLYEENGPPIDIADRLSASLPLFMTRGLAQRAAKRISELDRDLLESLRKRGFRTNNGIQDTGVQIVRGVDFTLVQSPSLFFPFEILTIMLRADVGASQLIADGKIKLKNNSKMKEFTETGLLFEDGSELPADVVVFATGLSDMRDHIRKICGDDIASKCPPIWGLDKQGEITGSAHEVGTPGLWYFTGNFYFARFHSKHLALQIKAKEEGLFGERYSLLE